MKSNELKLAESIVNYKANIAATQKYIKETFNVESEYNEEENTLHIWTENVNENLNVATAKEYIENTDCVACCVYGK